MVIRKLSEARDEKIQIVLFPGQQESKQLVFNYCDIYIYSKLTTDSMNIVAECGLQVELNVN